MQTKDIPTVPILKLLQENDEDINSLPLMAFKDVDHSIYRAFPEGTPEKLMLSKMSNLIKKGLVEGCACGCRGDFRLSEKGRDYLKRFDYATR